MGRTLVEAICTIIVACIYIIVLVRHMRMYYYEQTKQDEVFCSMWELQVGILYRRLNHVKRMCNFHYYLRSKLYTACNPLRSHPDPTTRPKKYNACTLLKTHQSRSNRPLNRDKYTRRLPVARGAEIEVQV